MDQYLRLITLLILVIVSSCAQVEAIDGGPKDEIAPRVKKITPENKSTLFSGRKIVYKFDEFIKLNNPQENLVILPAGPKVTASVFKKELTLEIEGDLAPNTTYQISMNALVRDNREGNDSLMRYVFSTGEVLDSISYAGKIVDAYSNELQHNITVGLYKAGDSISSKPRYFVKSDKKGEFKFEHLRPDSYSLYFFNDLNKDLQFQFNEKVGFSDSLITTNASITDSIAYRIFQNPLPAKIKEKKLLYPKQVIISSTFSLAKSDFYYQNEKIDTSFLHFYKDDSVGVLLPQIPGENNLVTIQSGDRLDSISLIAIQKSILQKPSSMFYPTDKDLSRKKTGFLLFSDEITGIDEKLIFTQTKDSVRVTPKITFLKNKLQFSFSDTISKELQLFIQAGAIKFSNGTNNDKTEVKLQFKALNNYGSLLFKKLDFPENALIEFILNKQVVLTKSKAELQKSKLISALDPGEYSFRIIYDENKNGKWDAGNVHSKKQAEKISYFSQTVKVRANWETEIELDTK